MKKMFALLMTLLLLFTMTACEQEDVELALDVAVAVLEEVEKHQSSQSESADSVEEIPPFSGDAYIAINGNVPFFVEEEITNESYEYYTELDSLGRCGITEACIGIDIMPTEDRGDIGSVKPTGWKSVKYDIVDGKYLYNRCHLIDLSLYNR